MFGKLWSRVKKFVSGLFPRRPPEPGRYESGTKSSLPGWLASAPWIWPRREYLVYVPRGYSYWRRAPLIVLLHGCRQTPEEIAAASRVAELADELGALVLLPRQNARANAWGCWNWFDPATAHGWGETAIVAAQIAAVRRKYRVDERRAFIAGMSSGGGLAAALGVRRPDLVAGTFVHSGIACGAASSTMAAIGVLRSGADTDYRAIARDARARAMPNALPVPLLAIQGSSDVVVAPVNATHLVRQYLALNGHPAADAGSDDELPPPDRTYAESAPDARLVTTCEWRVGDRLVVRHVRVDGLGHAWSGGDDRYPYSDPKPPDATTLLGTFVREALQ